MTITHRASPLVFRPPATDEPIRSGAQSATPRIASRAISKRRASPDRQRGAIDLTAHAKCSGGPTTAWRLSEGIAPRAVESTIITAAWPAAPRYRSRAAGAGLQETGGITALQPRTRSGASLLVTGGIDGMYRNWSLAQNLYAWKTIRRFDVDSVEAPESFRMMRRRSEGRLRHEGW